MKAIALALVVSISAFAQEQVWTWVDEQGEEHFTNDKSSIPESFRAKATSTEGAELSVLQTKDQGNAAAPAPGGRPLGKPVGVKVLVFEASTNTASKALRSSGALEKLLADNP